MSTPARTSPIRPPLPSRPAALAAVVVQLLIAALLPVLLVVATSSAARADVPIIDFTALPERPVELPGGWTAQGCEGDAPLLCTVEAGTPQGAAEHISSSLDSYTDLNADLDAGVPLHTALLREIDRHHEIIREDRQAGCGDGFEYVADPTVAATVAGGQGVRWGATLYSVPERRVVERTVGFMGIRGEHLDVVAAHEINEGSCISPEGMGPFTDGGLGRFTATLTQLVARASLGEGSGTPLQVGHDVALDGEDAVAAAIALSGVAAPDGVPGGTVLIARDDVFADALASGVLQGILDAPLLLTGGDRLDERTAAEIGRLGAVHAIILGGPAAVGEQVVADLRGLALDVERIAGADRIATALAIAEAYAPEAEEVVVVRADAAGDPTQAFADALAAGALAADHAAPVLLTGGRALDDRVAAWLDGRGVQVAVLAGGESALAEPVGQELVEIGLGVDRVGGAERAETATDLAHRRDVPTAEHADAVIVIDGRSWADGLAATLLAHRAAAPVVLVDGDRLPLPTEAFLTAVDPAEPPRVVCTPSVSSEACAEALAAVGRTT